MLCAQILALLACAWGPGFVAAEGGKSNTARCVACYTLGDHLGKRLSATEMRADEEVPIGIRIAGDGSEKPSKVVRYGNSERRLLDVLDGACEGNANKMYCNELLHDHDDRITTWFYEQRAEPFVGVICDAYISGCDASVYAASRTAAAPKATAEEVASSVASSDDDVKVEDESKAAEAARAEAARTVAEMKRKIDEAAKRVKEAAKKVDEASKKATTAKGAAPPKKASKVAKTSLLAALSPARIFGRIRNNVLRIRRLSLELYEPLALAARTGKWAPVITMVKDPLFLQTYWVVFFTIFTVLYIISSTISSLRHGGVAPTAGRTPRSRGAVGAATKRGKRSTSDGAIAKK